MRTRFRLPALRMLAPEFQTRRQNQRRDQAAAQILEKKMTLERTDDGFEYRGARLSLTTGSLIENARRIGENQVDLNSISTYAWFDLLNSYKLRIFLTRKAEQNYICSAFLVLKLKLKTLPLKRREILWSNNKLLGENFIMTTERVLKRLFAQARKSDGNAFDEYFDFFPYYANGIAFYLDLLVENDL